jgi:hypothetical protein
MGLFDTEIRQFEMYNQPLVDDPNSADLIGPAVVAMRREEDFMDHVKLALVAILGRKDIHKFQNIIEDGVTPNIEFPDSNINLLANMSDEHFSHLPAGATTAGARIGGLRVMDWVNVWMYDNVPGYIASQSMPSIVVYDDNGGYDIIPVIGAAVTSSGDGYNVFAIDHETDEAGGEPFLVVLDYIVPLIPTGNWNVLYYQMSVEPGGGEDPIEIPEKGVLAYQSEMDMGFGEESGELRTFPPLPLRVNNENYYAAFDEAKIDDIEKLGKIVGVDTGKLIDDVMEGAEEEGHASKMDHVFLNFGTRIHDNSEASCRYLHAMFKQCLEYCETIGNGSIGLQVECTSPWEHEIGGMVNPNLYKPSICNVITVETDDYYYDFTFSLMTNETMTVAAVLADEVMGPQYEDRANASGKFWYISSSSGDPSREEGYEQPPVGAGMWPVEGELPVEISFGECDGGDVRFIKIVGIGGKVRIKDTETGVVKMRRLNYDDPNSKF